MFSPAQAVSSQAGNIDRFSLSPAGSTNPSLHRFGFLGRCPNLFGFQARSSVPTNPSPNTPVFPFTPLFHLSHSPSLKVSTNTRSYLLTPDSTPHKPILDLFYPPQYNRSKKEIPIHSIFILKFFQIFLSGPSPS